MVELTPRQKELAELRRKKDRSRRIAVRILKQLGRYVEGYHVHHLDGNPFNNDPDNLIMLHPKIHAKITKRQMRTEKFRLKRKRRH